MKRFFTIIAAAMLVLSVASCSKETGGDNPPYYQVLTSYHATGGTSGSSDFTKIFAVTDQYRDIQFSSEDKAVSAYKDILAKTKDAPYSAHDDSFVKLSISKFIGKQEDEHTVRYEADPNYKSPVGHIWDAKGSRDL